MDFRLKVFLEVAEHLSFTRAAKELYISQPAISKHIQELEAAYQVQLFNRQNGRITLTHQGEIFKGHAQEIIQKYEELSNTMQMLSGSFSGEIKIGASTTIAQYLISPLLADFITKFPDVHVTLITGNSEEIENALLEERIDIGLVEGSKRRQDLKYEHFAKDELVLVTNSKTICEENVTCEQVKQLPLVLRELGSGTLEVIENALSGVGVKLQDLDILLHIGSTEAIKKFLESKQGSFAIVSIIAVLKELRLGELKIIDIDDLVMEREFAFVVRIGDKRDRVERFMNFSKLWYSNIYE